jgi:hypothetical protein
MEQGIPTSSFYSSRTTRVRITDTRIIRQNINFGIIVPDPNESEIEEDDDDDDDDDSDLKNINAAEEEMGNGTESDDDSDYIGPSEDDDDDDDENTPSQEKSFPNLDTACRWRKRNPAQVQSTFVGGPFPDPPQDMTPLKYFKQFFDDELISKIVEQTNLYSVQKTATSVTVTKDEIEHAVSWSIANDGDF